MEIILGKTAGFCYGVRNAVQKTEEKLKEHNQLFCLGELVHNGQVIKKLEKSGLKLVEEVDEAKDKIIIRAHGIPKEIYHKAKKLNIETLDFTCPNVLKIHRIADEYSSKGYYIFGDNEVSEVKYVYFEELEKMAKKRVDGLLIHEEEYKKLLNLLEKTIRRIEC